LGELLAEFRYLTKPKSVGEVEDKKRKDKKRRAELSKF